MFKTIILEDMDKFQFKLNQDRYEEYPIREWCEYYFGHAGRRWYVKGGTIGFSRSVDAFLYFIVWE